MSQKENLFRYLMDVSGYNRLFNNGESATHLKQEHWGEHLNVVTIDTSADRFTITQTRKGEPPMTNIVYEPEVAIFLLERILKDLKVIA